MTKLAPLVAIGIIFFFSEDRDTLTIGKIGVIGLIVLFSSMSVYFFYSFQPMSWLYGIFVALALPYSFRLFYLQAEKSNIKDVIYVNCFNCFGLFMISDLMLTEIKYVYYYYQTSTSILFYISIIMQVITGILSYILLMYIIKKLGLITTTVTYTTLQSLQLFFAYLFSLILFYDVTPTIFNIINIWLCVITTIYYFIRYCKSISFLDRSTFKFTINSNKR
uniref:EamA domain-containing protein n=1 Tax=Strongyloides papillosus TaxID=174720 RepID=A0A0N5CAT0_STREA